MRGVGCTQAGDRVPSLGRGIARNASVTLIGVAGGDVDEVGGVANGVRSDLVKGRVDRTERPTIDLARYGHESSPLRARQRCATDVVPARVVYVAPVAVRRARDIHK